MRESGLGVGLTCSVLASSVFLCLFFIIALLRRRIRLDLHLIKGHQMLANKL